MNGASEDTSVFWKKVTIPKGLPALLEIMTKETIRENPDDIVLFLSQLVESLIAKRDQENQEESNSKGSKRKSEEENPLLGNVEGLSGKYTKRDEEVAASKIQAGFRGYQTRKSLKSNVKKKGGDSSLTSLTPLNEVGDEVDEEDENDGEGTDEEELQRLEKVKDEAIAAEIKTPLETIREESIEGRLQAKTPDLHHPYHLEVETIGDRPKSANFKPYVTPTQSTTTIPEEESGEEESALTEKVDNSESEVTEAAKTTSNETVRDEENEPTVSNDNEIEFGDEPEPEGTPVEIKETEVETLVEGDEMPVADSNSSNYSKDESDETNDGMANEIKEADKTGAKLEEEGEKTENDLLSTSEVGEVEIGNNVPDTEKTNDIDPEVESSDPDVPELKQDIPLSEPDPLDDGKVLTSPENTSEIPENSGEPVNIPETENAVISPITSENIPTEDIEESKELDSKSEDDNPAKDEPTHSEQLVDETPIIKNETVALDGNERTSNEVPKPPEETLMTKSDTLMDAVDSIEFVDEEASVPSPKNPDDDDQAGKVDLDTLAENSNNNMSRESPSLTKCEQPSFANTDSVSSPATVRAADFDKRQDSSQDISSRSDTPIAKPRNKPAETISLDETEVSKRQRLEESKIVDEESKEVVAELRKEDAPAPVLRRQKSNPKSRAMSSKYRSGFVMDDSVSMEEMEAQIENEMLSNAATKIQAGFRGYKTRKSMRRSGVRFADNPKGTEDSEKSEDKSLEDNCAGARAESPIEAMAASASAFEPPARSASVGENPISASALGRGSRPPLALLRSRSYPGSHEDEVHTEGDEEESVPHAELEYDPAYVNNAATKIQASVRGFLVRRSFRDKNGPPSRLRNAGIKEPSEVEIESGELIINPADRDSISPMSEDIQSDQAAAKIQAAFRGYKDRKKCRQTKKAVVTIQATVRGFLTRRRLAKLRRYINSPIKRRSMQRRRSSAKMVSHEVQRIAKANEAATKIQSVFRGYQVRSKIRKNPTDE